uniref:Tetraspanin 32 n=1 Tax=Phasianus colchicus TaxID=9054 RepID=A0A669R7D5_PHACC
GGHGILMPCNSLDANLPFQLLGLSIATLSTVTRYGLHFSVISNVALESSSYRDIHHAAFYVGVFLSMTLIFAALLSAVAAVRESRSNWAAAVLILVHLYRCLPLLQVEDSMLDVYDLVYEEVRRNGSSSKRHELTLIHEVFLCCGKPSPLGDTAAVEHKMCHPGTAWAAGRVSCFSPASSSSACVYGMVLTSFHWFSIHFSNNLDRKGKYTLQGR